MRWEHFQYRAVGSGAQRGVYGDSVAKSPVIYRLEKRYYSLAIKHFQAYDFARLAFGNDLERTAAHFAIGRESLVGCARIEDQFKTLTAIRALNFFADFHPRNIRPVSMRFQPAINQSFAGPWSGWTGGIRVSSDER